MHSRSIEEWKKKSERDRTGIPFEQPQRCFNSSFYFYCLKQKNQTKKSRHQNKTNTPFPHQKNHMEIHWPQKGRKTTIKSKPISRTLLSCQYKKSVSFHNFIVSAATQPSPPPVSDCCTRFSDSLSYWKLLPFLKSASFSLSKSIRATFFTTTDCYCCQKELRTSQNSSQHHCQKKRKQPKDTASVKGAPVKCLWHVGTSATQTKGVSCSCYSLSSAELRDCHCM